MARITQISCSNPLCYNVIELVSDELWAVDEALRDFGWTIENNDEEYCPNCSLNDGEQTTQEELAF
jgi:hypothetical protein